jgi:hypothetical protein
MKWRIKEEGMGERREWQLYTLHSKIWGCPRNIFAFWRDVGQNEEGFKGG